MNEINGVPTSNLSQTKLEDTLKQPQEETDTALFDELAGDNQDVSFEDISYALKNKGDLLAQIAGDSKTTSLHDVAEALLESKSSVFSKIAEELKGKELNEDAIAKLKEKYGDALSDGILGELTKGATFADIIAKLTGTDKLSDEEIEEILNLSESRNEDLENFDVEEAHVYVEGEEEIAKMVEKEKMKHMLLGGAVAGTIGALFGIDTFDEAAVERECRAKYAKEHPEYRSVMGEGKVVENEYKVAEKIAMTAWEKENPKPEKPSGIFISKLSMFKYGIELEKWEKAKAEKEAAFEEQYAAENPNYANLKSQQKKDDTPKTIADIIGIAVKAPFPNIMDVIRNSANI